MKAAAGHEPFEEQEQGQDRSPIGSRSQLLLAIGLVAAAAALVLAVFPPPPATACDGGAGCAIPGRERREVVAVVTREGPPAAHRVAEVFRSIRSADEEGSPPPIPPSETWPAQ